MASITGGIAQVFTSAARTATVTSQSTNAMGHRGARFHLNITANAGTSETLDIKIQSVDPISKVALDLTGAAFVQKTGSGFDTLTVYPGIGETANEAVNDVLPMIFQAVATIGGSAGQSFTFTLTAELFN